MMEADQPSPPPSPVDGMRLDPYSIDVDVYSLSETSNWMEKEADAYWESLDETKYVFYLFQVALELYTYSLL
jgi:hypothetical protein